VPDARWHSSPRSHRWTQTHPRSGSRSDPSAPPGSPPRRRSGRDPAGRTPLPGERCPRSRTGSQADRGSGHRSHPARWSHPRAPSSRTGSPLPEGQLHRPDVQFGYPEDNHLHDPRQPDLHAHHRREDVRYAHHSRSVRAATVGGGAAGGREPELRPSAGLPAAAAPPREKPGLAAPAAPEPDGEPPPPGPR
jgi:hypothetical protein